MRLTYLGTAMLLLETEGRRFVTDPALDPAGTHYDFGPWYTPRSWFASEKTYATPLDAPALGALDGVLLSHDHHADNLDYEGRRFLASAAAGRVVTTAPAARRLARAAVPDAMGRTQPGDGLGLAGRTTGLAWGASTELGGLRITATPARHGPLGTPRIHEVNGFVIEPASSSEPVVWVTGDTVMFPALEDTARALRARSRKVDVLVVHCGGVCFPKLPVLGKRRFTFAGRDVVDLVRRVEPRVVIPIHREGWAHFREPLATLREELDAGGVSDRVRWLELGQSTTV